jgi:hypothetical protein
MKKFPTPKKVNKLPPLKVPPKSPSPKNPTGPIKVKGPTPLKVK